MSTSSAPAWTFRGRSEDKNNFTTPGPGNYNPTLCNLEKPPNFKIGTSSRPALLSSTTPGPGTYEAKSTIINKPAPKIGSSKRLPLSETLETPGPGAYQVEPKVVPGPKFTMLGRKDQNNNSLNPGPGHYDQSSNELAVKDRAPAYKIGSGSRTERPNSDSLPGPGTYNSDAKTIGPSWGFGSQARSNSSKVNVPGPGSYSNTDLISKKGFTITGRPQSSIQNSNPGPGSYNPSDSINKTPGWSLGKSSRGSLSSNTKEIPGPGAYSPQVTIGKSASVFGSSARKPINNIFETPGPGEYNIVNKTNAPAFTMRPKTASNKKNLNPGPGEYNPSLSCSELKWTIGKEQKGLNFSIEKGVFVPGPGHYDVNKQVEGPKWGFGSEKKNKDIKNPNPGPGSYTDYPSIGNLPGYAKK
ncbi:hypothetical protein SteCoe_18142 [Stentor coeruleus]|uniref:Uncharacterized protein n=1 Tax=Stentor coeruleus TaxID=5963 RepID=A0A1R2BXB2_9CILI|nr:hypothetical protein SteCoe_18142 [Stentor coeruleus]